jgi:hypothetical protein
VVVEEEEEEEAGSANWPSKFSPQA